MQQSVTQQEYLLSVNRAPDAVLKAGDLAHPCPPSSQERKTGSQERCDHKLF